MREAFQRMRWGFGKGRGHLGGSFCSEETRQDRDLKGQANWRGIGRIESQVLGADGIAVGEERGDLRAFRRIC